MRIRKFKLVQGQVEVTFTERKDDGSEKTVNELHKSTPHPDLDAALQRLAIHWAILVGFLTVKAVKNIAEPKAELVEGIHISNISIKTGDDEGVVITGNKKLESGKAVNINTPFQRYTETEESAYKFTDDLIERIERVVTEAEAFLDGSKRGIEAQQSLHFSDELSNNGGQVQNRLPEDAVIISETNNSETTASEIEQRLEDKTIWKDGQRPVSGTVNV